MTSRWGERVEGLVSVVIPTYNRAERLPRAVRSVIEQNYRPLEVVVADDGSTDNTAQVVQKMQYEAEREGCRFVYHYQDNRGAPAARNAGVARSRGAFIQYLDSDDYLLPDKIGGQVRHLETSGNELVYGITLYVGDSGIVQGVRNRPPRRGHRCGWISELSWHTSSPLFRRELVERIGKWKTDLDACQEYEYGARAKIACDGVGFEDRPVSVAVMHDDGRISDRDRVKHGLSCARAAALIWDAIEGTRWDRMCERNRLALNVATRAAALSRRREDRAARYCRSLGLRIADGSTLPFVWSSLWVGRMLRLPCLRSAAWWLRRRVI